MPRDKNGNLEYLYHVSSEVIINTSHFEEEEVYHLWILQQETITSMCDKHQYQ